MAPATTRSITATVSAIDEIGEAGDLPEFFGPVVTGEWR
jgi:hypothetical protein